MKGGDFEREICKLLSLWWTGGARDDIYWRTAGSGGRATMRAKRSKTTANSCGDICALDPVGQPLLDLMVFEVKRGYNHATLHAVIDKAPQHKKQEFELWIAQAEASRAAAGARSWAIIHKRDQRRTMIYLPAYLHAELEIRGGADWDYSTGLLKAYVADPVTGGLFTVIGMSLGDFMAGCPGECVRVIAGGESSHVSRPENSGES